MESSGLRTEANPSTFGPLANGWVPEWSNGLAWKACVPHKGTEGSNPSPSAMPLRGRRAGFSGWFPAYLPLGSCPAWGPENPEHPKAADMSGKRQPKPESFPKRCANALLSKAGLCGLTLGFAIFYQLIFNRLDSSIQASGERGAPAESGTTWVPAGDVAATEPPQEGALPGGFRAVVPVLPPARKDGSTEVFGRSLRKTPMGQDGVNPHHDRGRVCTLDPAGVRGLAKLQPGVNVMLPSFDGEGMLAEVESRLEDRGWLRLGGRLKEADGTFTLNTNFDRVFGLVLMPQSEVAVEISTERSGQVVMVERRLSSVVCSPLPKDAGTENQATAGTNFQVTGESPVAAAADADSNLRISSGGIVPEISTRPRAKGVVYLDFDGEKVSDNSWNGGKLIDAAASGLTPLEIRQVVARVAEDFAPFDINVTTQRSNYDNAPVRQRMRVIVTPTDTANPGSGGVSYVNSWSRAGHSFSETIPAWVFNTVVKSVAEAVSHEVGHTLGLNHDGTRFSSYYSGHGGTLANPTSWAPIMGKSYDRSLTQWSRGEYSSANNTEDDLAIIGKTENGVAFAAPDQSGIAGALAVKAGSFGFSGVLRDSLSPHQFVFSTRGGSFSASALPSTEVIGYANADLQLRLQSISDLAPAATLAIANPLDALGGSVVRNLSPGTYCLTVASAKNGDDTGGVYASGYPTYGSVGGYRVSASLAEGDAALLPVWAGTFSGSGVAGKPFILGFQVSEGSVVSVDESALPPGILFESTDETIDSPTPGEASVLQRIWRFTGTPAIGGNWTLSARAVNGAGANACRFTINIEPEPADLAAALGGLSDLRTSGIAPWSGYIVARADGQQGPVAASGRIGDDQSSSLHFSVNGPGVLSFWWKVSSEPRNDGLRLLLNGRSVVDPVARGIVYLSGESSWQQRKIKLPRGASTVEFRYSKDEVLAGGMDRAWVYGIKVGKPPLITRGLDPLVRLPKGVSDLSLSAAVTDATRYVWRVNGVTLANTALPNRVVTGATSATLSIKGLGGADIGVYELEAFNEFGSVVSKAIVNAPLPPEIVQPPIAPVGLKAGQPMILTVQSSGQWPLYYEWFKDGRSVQRGGNPSFQVAKASFLHAGKYRVVVSNPAGKVSSDEIQLAVETPVRAQRR